jgi:omega-6 fatty acid desaturase (delta-12 desaturase)
MTASRENWQTNIDRYSRPDSRRAWWQVVNSLVPYLAVWCLMCLSLDVSYWITLALSVVAAGLYTRLFIIFHDCGHGSFLRSRRANDLIGFAFGVLTFTPYGYWRHLHAIHHATAGNLDRRGTGDIWTLTVREYRESSRWRRLRFRFYRNPFVLLLLAPAYLFLINHRFAARGAGRRWHVSVLWTNLGILGIAVGLSLLIGVRGYLMIQLPVVLIAGTFGVWLFYVQHQFEGVYWSREKSWDYVQAALRGSTFYRLPGLLRWFSGNIGFHHVHHLSPRVPNYFLDKCHRDTPLLQRVRVLGLLESLRSLHLRAWDEERRKLVGLGPAFL